MGRGEDSVEDGKEAKGLRLPSSPFNFVDVATALEAKAQVEGTSSDVPRPVAVREEQGVDGPAENANVVELSATVNGKGSCTDEIRDFTKKMHDFKAHVIDFCDKFDFVLAKLHGQEGSETPLPIERRTFSGDSLTDNLANFDDDLQSYKSNPSGLSPDQIQALVIAIHGLEQQRKVESTEKEVGHDQDHALLKLEPKLVSVLTKHPIDHSIHFYYLRSFHSTFVSVENDKLTLSGHKRPFEQWTFEDLGDNLIAVRSRSCGKYLSASSNGSVAVVPKLDMCETWTVRPVEDTNKACFVSHHGTFLSATMGGELRLVKHCHSCEWWN